MSATAGPFTAGLDVGATKIAACVLDPGGAVRYFDRRSTEGVGTPADLVDTLVDLVESCRRNARRSIEAVGVGAAGQVDRSSGVLRASPNLDWTDVPLGPRLEDRLEGPVTLVNDVDAAAWGEALHGAGRDTDHLLGVFVGTGVGVGAVRDGRLITGCTASAVEFGHVTVEAGGRNCSCRNRGCLEAYVGGWALAERTRAAARRDPDRAGALVAEAGSIEELGAQQLATCYERGDPLAVELVEETARYLAAGLVGMVNVFHPCVLVLGGGVIQGLPGLVDRVKEPVNSRCFPVFAESLRIRRSELKDRAAAVGAAALARDRSRGV